MVTPITTHSFPLHYFDSFSFARALMSEYFWAGLDTTYLVLAGKFVGQFRIGSPILLHVFYHGSIS